MSPSARFILFMRKREREREGERPEVARDAAQCNFIPLLQIIGRRMSTGDSGVEMSLSPHTRTLPTPHVVVGANPVQTPRLLSAFPDDDPSLYRDEIDGLMRQHPQQNYQRLRPTNPVNKPTTSANSILVETIKIGRCKVRSPSRSNSTDHVLRVLAHCETARLTV